MDEENIWEAIERIEAHTQYFVPADDLWALNIALDALREKAEKESLKNG